MIKNFSPLQEYFEKLLMQKQTEEGFEAESRN
jgi:hypothetical protein